MTSRDFAYWLQGFFEIADPKAMTEAQVAMVKRHLAMVFLHELDPSFPAVQQGALNAAHAPESTSPTEAIRPPWPSASLLARC